MLAGQFRQAGDGVAVDVEEASGLPDATALAEVVEDGAGLLLGQVGVDSGVPLRSEKRYLQALQESSRM